MPAVERLPRDIQVLARVLSQRLTLAIPASS
jgi:hypothetical protein